jgi:phospholipid N-methyltransferase
MTKTLSAYWNFLVAGLLKSEQTGAVVPSQRFLIEKMIAPVPRSYRGEIIELGPGTGALTRRLARRCPQTRILACEINPDFARDCARALAVDGFSKQVRVVCDSAEHMLAERARKRLPRPEFVISGIPLGTLDRKRVQALVGCIHESLAEGGQYIQFQYSLLDKNNIRSKFPNLNVRTAFLNFPPAFVYYARK